MSVKKLHELIYMFIQNDTVHMDMFTVFYTYLSHNGHRFERPFVTHLHVVYYFSILFERDKLFKTFTTVIMQGDKNVITCKKMLRIHN